MKKVYLFLMLLLSVAIYSQESNVPQQTNLLDNVRFGGGFGLNFGNNSTTFSVSPSAIYDFNDSFSLGLGVSYLYNKRNNLKSNVFSGSILSLYNPFKKFLPELQLSAEYEHLFVNRSFANTKDTYNYPALHMGIAYTTGYFSIGVRYDLLYRKNKSIYASPISPIVRIFF